MKTEFNDTPLRFSLHGRAALVTDDRFGAVGMSLMDEVWAAVRKAGAATTGINHWVYLADGRMFVGLELLPNSKPTKGLEPLEFELGRRLEHVHVGPYQALPEKWKALQAALVAQGEAIGSPSLEIYGHPCDQPAKLETTILIGLRPRS